MTMCKFSLTLAQLLIGRGSDLNSIEEAQLFPNVKSYCSKTFAFAGLVAIQNMLYIYAHMCVLRYFLLTNLYVKFHLVFHFNEDL